MTPDFYINKILHISIFAEKLIVFLKIVYGENKCLNAKTIGGRRTRCDDQPRWATNLKTNVAPKIDAYNVYEDFKHL